MPTVSSKRLASFCHQMGVSLKAGLDTRKAFGTCKHLLGKGHTASLSLITDELEQGSTLHECIRKCPKTFPPLLSMLVQVGELSGKTESAFKGLANYYDNRVALIRGFFKRVTWPVLQFVIATGVVGLVLFIMGMLLGNGGAGELLPSWIADDSLFSKYCGLMFVLYGFAGGVGYGVYMQWLNIEVFVGLLSLLPGVKHPFLNLAMSRFCWTFSLVHNAGVDAERSVAMAIKSSGNPVYIKTLQPVLDAIRNNEDFYSAFASTDVYPAAFLSSLMTAEQAGTISESLWQEAATFRLKAESQLQWLSKVCTGLIYGGVAVFIIIMIFVFYKTFILNPINTILG
ncbi:MAG: hypothetical protein CMJ76_02645 [Planctomycetaceae bacterium]|nr:hypothetical protein [Planctomycetaceae bacterium]